MDAIDTVHSLTGLSWWASIPLTAYGMSHTEVDYRHTDGQLTFPHIDFAQELRYSTRRLFGHSANEQLLLAVCFDLTPMSCNICETPHT